MKYNEIMKNNNELQDAVHMVRFTAFLWLGYLLILAAINFSLGPPQRPPEVLSNLLYYTLHALIAVVLLVLGYWAGYRRNWVRFFYLWSSL